MTYWIKNIKQTKDMKQKSFAISPNINSEQQAAAL